MKKTIKIISIILIDCLLISNIALAGDFKAESDLLSAPLQIGQDEFFNAFFAIRKQAEVYLSVEGTMSPELARRLFGTGYARVYDKFSGRHMGYWVDGLVYVRDKQDGEFTKCIGLFCEITQTFTKPGESPELTIQDMLRMANGTTEHQINNKDDQLPKKTMFKSKKDMVIAVGFLALAQMVIIMPVVGQAWEFIYGYYPKTYMSISVFAGSIIALATLIPALIMPNLLPWKKIGSFLSSKKNGAPEKSKQKTSRIQTNGWATAGVFFATFYDQIHTWFIQHPAFAVMVGTGIGLVSGGYLIYRLVKYEQFINIIRPLRSGWYIWRLNLRKDNDIDQRIIEIIEKSYTRQQIIKQISLLIKENEDKKGQKGADQERVEKIDKYLRRILFGKLARMGKDSVVLGAIYRIYSIFYRAGYYKRKINLEPKKNYCQREFLDCVKRGYTLEEVVQSYLRPNLRSSLAEYRRGSKEILEKLVKAGFVKEEQLIDMYLEVLEKGRVEAVTDVIVGLRDYIDKVSDQGKTKMILKLHIVIKKLEKKVKKARSKTKKPDIYYQDQYESRQKELLKVQALLTHTVLNVLSDFKNRDDLGQVIEAAQAAEGCFKMFGDGLWEEFRGYLRSILNKLESEQEKLKGELREEPLLVRLKKRLPKSEKDEKNEQIKSELKSVARNIKTINNLLSRLEKNQEKQNKSVEKQEKTAKNGKNGPIFTAICVIADLAGSLINNNNKNNGFIEQAI
jgi:hypothetical protein